MNDITVSSVISVLILIVAIIITLFVIVETAKRIKDWYQYKKTPEKTMQAAIVDKHIDFIWRSGHARLDGATLNADADYCLTFELEDHNKLDLCVIDKDYDSLQIGDSGKLTFKKDAFVSFEKDEKTDSADDGKDLTVTNVPEQSAD